MLRGRAANPCWLCGLPPVGGVKCIISAANIHQVFPRGNRWLRICSHQSKTKAYSGSKMINYSLNKVLLKKKKTANDILIPDNAFSFYYLKNEYSLGICHWAPRDLCLTPIVLFGDSAYSLTVGASCSLGCEQQVGKDWILFI